MMNYSIIVPYYDKYDLFKKAVDSIPDRDDIQVVIVDNAPHSLDKKLIPRKENAKVLQTKVQDVHEMKVYDM